MHLLPLRRTKRATEARERPQLLNREAAAKAAGVCTRTVTRAVELWSRPMWARELKP